MSSPHQIPVEEDVPPEELVEPPDDDVDPPDEEVEPPEDEVDDVEPPDEDVDDVEPPDEDVELPPPLVLLDDVLGAGSPVDGAAGSVPSVVDATSDEGVPKRSLSFAPPQAARRAIEEASAALMKRLVFMRVAKH